MVNYNLFGGVYNNKRVLVTGHTGFKGSWLVEWLTKLGAIVAGYALSPNTKPSHFQMLGSKMKSNIADINNAGQLEEVINDFNPEIVFHLAAQAMVLTSYEKPIDTFNTNTLGTAKLLEACRTNGNVKAIVVITTDKVYSNKEWKWGYRENDTLGGYDPYSASKAATEIVCDSYRNAFFNPTQFNKTHATLLTTVRAGNVIGGGDWGEHRLVPDIVRNYTNKTKLEIRNPSAIRPWQHVLEPLSGYLLLGQKLLEGKTGLASAWNFGPNKESCIDVTKILEAATLHLENIDIEVGSAKHHETSFLHLDSSKAYQLLGWKPTWNIATTLEKTFAWYKKFHTHNSINTQNDIEAYINDANTQQQKWAKISDYEV